MVEPYMMSDYTRYLMSHLTWTSKNGMQHTCVSLLAVICLIHW